jgi:uncharacterized membrane protein
MQGTPSIDHRRRSIGVGLVLILMLAIGAVLGGYLDYRAWHSNAALEAAIPVLLAIVIAIVAGALWLARRQRQAGLIAVAAVVFIVGFRIGAWVAPSANAPDWSPGTITLDLQDPALGLASGAASCRTESDGSFSVGSDPTQSLAGTPVTYYLAASGSSAPDQGFFELLTDPNGGAGPRWDTNVEGDTTVDIRIDGQAAAGRAELVDIPLGEDAPHDGGFPGGVPGAISGVLTWTCETPRGELTPIEGSWFH